jgi:hypothetical protein
MKFISIILLLSLFIVIVKPPVLYNVSSRLNDLTNLNDLDNYGSGRIEIAKFLFLDIFQRNALHLFIGKPVIDEYEATESHFGLTLWAHNDFLMILYTLGLIGLFIYLFYMLIKPIKYLLKKKALNKNSNTFILGLGLIAAMLVIAVSNGFYYYFMTHSFFYILYLMNEQQNIKELKATKK